MSADESDSDSVSIIARVNNEGSGIFVRESVSGLLYDESTQTYNAEYWDGLTFMTPGASSIQHMILMNIVKNELHFDFVQMGTEHTGSGVVYWTAVSPGTMVDKLLSSSGSEIDGGIAWEPHYANAISNSQIKSVMLTSEYWEGHPCCVIAASNAFIDDNPAATMRYLSAYCEAVEWLNEAKDVNSENHALLIQYVQEYTTVTDQATIELALSDVSYSYEIANLKEQIVELTKTYESLGLFSNTLQEIGYADEADFANALVNDKLISSAENRTPSSYASLNNVTIRVAYLASDIHQIALNIGIEQGFFDDFGITIEKVGPFAAGGDVMTAILLGQADMGFVGSPPVVLYSVNMAK
ncbi:MAG: ABC transporter substrate-binding protein [Candidatus Methanomethylophilaceae archaeon]|jgi:NitT/TauT family transport system substrate-binding protein